MRAILIVWIVIAAAVVYKHPPGTLSEILALTMALVWIPLGFLLITAVLLRGLFK
jgi:hypothetical protein